MTIKKSKKPASKKKRISTQSRSIHANGASSTIQWGHKNLIPDTTIINRLVEDHGLTKSQAISRLKTWKNKHGYN